VGRERFHGLRSRIVELTRLADDDGAGAEDEDRSDRVVAGHFLLSGATGAGSSGSRESRERAFRPKTRSVRPPWSRTDRTLRAHHAVPETLPGETGGSRVDIAGAAVLVLSRRSS